MLIDEVDVDIKAGHGGKGRTSFGGHGPDGGNGGKGGDVYITVTSDLRALNQFSATKEIKAADGEAGSNNCGDGRKGNDTEIFMPVGCVLTEQNTGEVIEFNEIGSRILICKGGLGGKGNFEFKSGKNRSPKYHQPGLPGDFKTFHVVLKYLADFGLIGLPNAGKSSLLNRLTNARAAVGAYPFTTLEANLGVLNQKVIADIPGLIAGASEGRGLGIKFLKHIEKVRLLLHCIAADSADVMSDYKIINNELALFSPDLANKPQVILITKTDLSAREDIDKQIKLLKSLKKKIYKVSVYDQDSIQKLKLLLK